MGTKIFTKLIATVIFLFTALASFLIAPKAHADGIPTPGINTPKYLVNFAANGYNLCSGVAINQRWIITARSCETNLNAFSQYIWAHTISSSAIPNGTMSPIESITLISTDTNLDVDSLNYKTDALKPSGAYTFYGWNTIQGINPHSLDVTVGKAVIINNLLTAEGGIQARAYTLISEDEEFAQADLGGPIIDEQGNLAGILIGVNAKNTHIGYALSIDEIAKELDNKTVEAASSYSPPIETIESGTRIEHTTAQSGGLFAAISS